MDTLADLRLAFAGLVTNRLRSGLCVLGVLIGVAALVLLVAFGNGTSAQVASRMDALGPDLVYVYPNSQRVLGISQGFGSGRTLTQDDVQALNDRSQAPDLVAAIPVAGAPGTLQYQDRNWFAPTSGTTQDYAQARGYTMAAGSFFSAADVQNSARVVVLGQTVVDNLFNGDSQAAVGRTIMIARKPFTVVGTFAAKGSGALGNQDNLAVVPITAAWNYLLGTQPGKQSKSVSQIILVAAGPGRISAAESEAATILLQQHHIADPAQADFTMLSPQDVLRTSAQFTAISTFILGAVAAVALLLSGIRIMRVMLATVTERTREIGAGRAARRGRRDVRLQLLIESLTLTGIGSALGVGAGVGLCLLSDRVVPGVAGGTIPPPVVSVPSILLAVGLSLGIGLFFGIYPASHPAVQRPRLRALPNQ